MREGGGRDGSGTIRYGTDEALRTCDAAVRRRGDADTDSRADMSGRRERVPERRRNFLPNTPACRSAGHG
jgi:hypothetical protein